MSYNCYDDEDGVDRYKNYGWKSGAKMSTTTQNTNEITSSKYFSMDYRNPWDNESEGTWIVTKKEGGTSITRIEKPALAEVEYALAILYTGVMKAVQDSLEKNKYFISPHDYVMAGIEYLRKEINNGKGTL